MPAAAFFFGASSAAGWAASAITTSSDLFSLSVILWSNDGGWMLILLVVLSIMLSFDGNAMWKMETEEWSEKMKDERWEMKRVGSMNDDFFRYILTFGEDAEKTLNFVHNFSLQIELNASDTLSKKV